MKIKPDIAAMDAARNHMDTVAALDKTPARAPARLPTSLAGGVTSAFSAGPALARALTAPPSAQRGRGALSNASGRFETETRCHEDDGWDLPEDLPRLRTQVTRESATSRGTIHPIFPSTGRSIPIAAASMVVSIVSRGQPTLISACPRVSISRQGFLPRPMRQASLSANCQRRAMPPKPLRLEPIPTPISRSSATSS